jgi:p24 family protein delta-1
MRPNETFLFVLVVVFAALLSSTHSLIFYLQPNVKKCLKEEIHKDILVKGEYELTEIVSHHTKLEVLDSKGHILYNKEDAVKGKFAFTTDEYDVFQICFETQIQGARGTEGLNKEVHLTVKHGVEAKDYENVKMNYWMNKWFFAPIRSLIVVLFFFFLKLAKVEKLKPLEVELRRLEDLSQDIVSDFAYMKAREEEMRSTNGNL